MQNPGRARRGQRWSGKVSITQDQVSSYTVSIQECLSVSLSFFALQNQQTSLACHPALKFQINLCQPRSPRSSVHRNVEPSEQRGKPSGRTPLNAKWKPHTILLKIGYSVRFPSTSADRTAKMQKRLYLILRGRCSTKFRNTPRTLSSEYDPPYLVSSAYRPHGITDDPPNFAHGPPNLLPQFQYISMWEAGVLNFATSWT